MFYFDNFYGKKILKSSLLSDYDCFFTTREFVLTAKDTEDLKETALNNRSFLTKKLEADNIITAGQVHGDNIEIITSSKTHYDNTDALISNTEGTLFLMNFADCTPVILYDKTANTGAIIHAGWRGTAQNIAEKTVLKMQKKLKTKPENITALIGPSIGKCCFETNEDVFVQLIKDKNDLSLYQKKGSKYYIDLKMLNCKQLQKTGVKNIDICSCCTCCMSDIFFSYRKEKGKTARHSAVVKIKRG